MNLTAEANSEQTSISAPKQERNVSVNLGVFLQPVHSPERDPTAALQEDREQIIMADRLGFSECWIGEHVAALTEPVSDPLIFCASLLDATSNIKLGTGVLCLPQHHPASLAAKVAMFDHLARGRFLLGVGPGGLSSDTELFGLGDPKNRAAMMLESFDMIMKIWNGEPPYDIKGKFWNTKLQNMKRIKFGVGAILKPYQRPHPPIATSIMAPNSETAYTAGKRGWIPISGASLVQPRYVASHWERYAQGADEAGYKADRSIWRVTRNIWVGESDAEAEDYVSREDGPFRFYFDYIMSSFTQSGLMHYLRPDGREQDETVTCLDIVRSQVAYGSPDTVLDRLVELADRLGPFGTLLLTTVEWDEPELGRTSLRLLGEKVGPRLKQHLASRLAASRNN